jgi:hypothetical protein
VFIKPIIPVQMTFMEGLFNIKVIVVQSKLNVYSTMNIIISTLNKGSINVCMLCGYLTHQYIKNIYA